MPTRELLEAQDVTLTISLQAIISKHGGCVVCDQCGEDIINERYILLGEKCLCNACANGAYYAIQYHLVPADLLSLLGQKH